MNLLVEVPEELINEPYSDDDSGLHPECLIPRPRLLFKIMVFGVDCYIDSKILKNKAIRASYLPKKSICRVSVINVYDTYGVGIAYSFLKSLYLPEAKMSRLCWLEVYLRASLSIILGSEVAELNHREDRIILLEQIVNLSSLIMNNLLQIDSLQPKMIGELEPSSCLSLDLLAKIIRSKRVSKSLNNSRIK